jgi:hypothetical protein
MTALEAGHIILDDAGYAVRELHHYRKKGAGAGGWLQKVNANDLLLVGVIPVELGHAHTVHLHEGDRAPIERLSDAEILWFAKLMIRQVDMIINRQARG